VNSEELINLAAEAMADRQVGVAKTYDLCVKEGKIVCVPYGGVRLPEIVMGTFTESQIQKGLNAAEWMRLGARMMNYWKAKKL